MNPSPLRYPGGKTKLYNKVSNIIVKSNLKGCVYIEPFAGGAGLALQLLYNGLVDKIVINDFDYHVYSFWYSILNNKSAFCSKLIDTPIDIVEWNKQKEIYNNYLKYDMLDVGFSFFFLNRTNRSGILKAGPIGGKKQNGTYKIDCRFNKENLIEKINVVYSYRSKIVLHNKDAIDFISQNISRYRRPCFVNFDPPYYNQGQQLYTNFYKEQNHRNLYTKIASCQKPWIVTYDNCKFIIDLYKSYRKEDITLNYSAGNIKVGQEVLFYNDYITI
jgi:DNA adenine methylase